MNIKLRKQCLGMGLIGWVVAIPVVLVVIAFLFCEANKAYWDHKVTEMCEKDGGVTVYEKVEISKTDYPDIQVTSKNLLILPSEKNVKLGYPFFYRYRMYYMRQGFLNVVRHEQSIVRSHDGKLLSKHISYGRSGGDFPTGFHPSHFSCGRDEDILKLL
ncbi:MAG: hypothetical protein QGD96_12625, partial [Anaerolineae bacterium]|nr:hypothetical protein [Anaerolineae bacterium]